MSAAMAAIKYSGILVDGLVLTSSITSNQKHAISLLDIGEITVPTLLVHHAKDACQFTDPSLVPKLLAGFTNAPGKQDIFIHEGSGATGRFCGAHHYHGFINAESETVEKITAWIKGRR